MSFNTNNISTKNICHRYNKNNSAFYSCKSNKMRSMPLKKVLPSRKLEPTSTTEVKSYSTGVISNVKKIPITRKKTTKSDNRFDSKRSVVDFCGKCGDSKAEKSSSCKSYLSNISHKNSNDIETQVAIDLQRSKKKVCEKKKLLQQYYKNENFKRSVKEDQIKNSNLDPIKEGTENPLPSTNSSEPLFEVYTESVEEIGFLDPEDEQTIRDIKNFRNNNYFECHSAKARITSKGSVTSLNDHKCVYRFYLNDRLFPTPLNTDYQKIVRCIDCHLPLEFDSNSEDTVNGTIQAKVKIDNEIQDLILMLPVKKPLIIQEKRSMKDKDQTDILYFGIVKLNYNGDSIFKSNLPNDSLALRYQKGYREFIGGSRYQYEKVQDDDVIII